MSERSTEERLDALERRLADLEGHVGPSSSIPGVVDRLGKVVDARIQEHGIDIETTTVGQVEANMVLRRGKSTIGWSEDSLEIERIFATDPEDIARGISGLAHPARIALVKALVFGTMESAALLEVAGLNTTGQLYHHLQAMAEVGLVERRGRNQWACTGVGVGAAMMLLSAGILLADWRGPDTIGEFA